MLRVEFINKLTDYEKMIVTEELRLTWDCVNKIALRCGLTCNVGDKVATDLMDGGDFALILELTKNEPEYMEITLLGLEYLL